MPDSCKAFPLVGLPYSQNHNIFGDPKQEMQTYILFLLKFIFESLSPYPEYGKRWLP